MSHPPVRLTRPTRPTVTGRWVLALWVLATLGIYPPAHAGVTAVAEPANAPLERADQDAPTFRQTGSDMGSDADWAQLLRGLRAAAQAEAPPRPPHRCTCRRQPPQRARKSTCGGGHAGAQCFHCIHCCHGSVAAGVAGAAWRRHGARPRPGPTLV